ncbi:MAG: hypothetical protein AAB656_03545 [Patescibacteria group bacterium]
MKERGEKGRVIEVGCQCGQPLARYEKVGKGKLQKMYLDMILEDRTGIFIKEGEQSLSTGTEIYCSNCGKRVATVQMIHGRPAAKINHGVVKPVRT